MEQSRMTDSVAAWGQAMSAEDYAMPSVNLLRKPAFEQVFSCSAPVASWASIMQAEDSTGDLSYWFALPCPDSWRGFFVPTGGRR
jgi:hypothetical protein